MLIIGRWDGGRGGNILFGDLSKDGTIVPVIILHCIDKDLAGRRSVLAILFVTDFVHNEQEVDL